MKSKITTFILLFIFVSWMGCDSKQNSKEKSRDELLEEKKERDIEKLLSDFPSPSLVPFTLKSIGSQFNKKFINNISNIQYYKGDYDKLALNLGIYISDISYLAAYGHEKDCIDYLKVVHDIAESLGSHAYGEEYISEFSGHIQNENQTEIASVLTRLFKETSMKMEEEHQLNMMGLALTGSFVEGLYQAVLTIDAFPEGETNEVLLEPLVKIVLGEENALVDLIQVLEDLPFDKTIAKMLSELSILDKLYKNDMKDIESKLESDPNFILTKNSMIDLTIEIMRVRDAIVRP